MISILKIKCLTTNKIFIAHTKNQKEYLKTLRKRLRKRKCLTFQPVIHNMTDNIEVSVLEEFEDENKINEKRQFHIINNSECINHLTWRVS
jgi:hypothetical protein